MNRLMTYAFTLIIVITFNSCAPIKQPQQENKQESPQEAYIRTFPNDIVKVEPGCLRPDFSKLTSYVESGSVSLKVTFSKNGVPNKADVVSPNLSLAQSRLIEAAFMKCKYVVDSAISIPNNFQREYFYDWNEKPLVGIGRCMFSSQSYPILSRRLKEEGITVAAYYIESKTKMVTIKIIQSSGFDCLDEATTLSLSNCLAYDSVQNDLKKDLWVYFKQNWRVIEGM